MARSRRAAPCDGLSEPAHEYSGPQRRHHACGQMWESPGPYSPRPRHVPRRHESLGTVNEAELIARIRAGDRAAFETFYRRTQAAVCAYARSLLIGRPGEVDEVVQEVYVGFLGRIQRFERGRNPRPYLMTSVRNAVVDRKRARHRGEAGDVEPAGLGDSRDDPARTLARAERDRMIDAALEELPEEQREAVRLHLFAGLTHAEVAEVTGVPVATARNRYRYGMARLERRLGAYVHDERT